MRVTSSSGRNGDAEKIASRLRFNPEFASKVTMSSRQARLSSSRINRSCGAAPTPRFSRAKAFYVSHLMCGRLTAHG
jgi:hypothetical protein